VTFRVVSSLALVLPCLVLAPPASACSVAPASPVDVEAPTLHLELTAGKGTYRRGESARVLVEVTQLVVGGPPVRDAVTQVELTVGSRRVKRVGGSTDAEGRLTLAFVVPPKAPQGRVTAVATSHVRMVVSAECDDLVSATGSATVEPLMTVRG